MADPIVFAQANLSRTGLDIVQPFNAAHYNQWAKTQNLSMLPLFGRPGALALLVGNTRSMWSHFLTAFREQRELRASPDPLDRFVTDTITGCAQAIHDALDLEVVSRFGHHTGDALVSMLHAADIAGLALTGPVHLAVHPSHGPWFALRAVLVLDHPPPPTNPRPFDPCYGCEAPCKPAYERAMSRLGRRDKEHAHPALKPYWKDWLAIRDACPVGRDARYGELQIRYHYSKERAAIDEAIKQGDTHR